MAHFYLVPTWFFGFDIALQLFFAAVTLFIAVYSFKMYSYSCQRECKYFGVAFSFFFAAYLIWAAINFFISGLLNDAERGISLGTLSLYGNFGVYSYVALSLLGLSTLVYMTFRSAPLRLFSLIASLSLVTLIFSDYKAIAFYFISSFLLLFVFLYYFREYKQNARGTTLLVFFAFMFLFLGTLDFTLAAVRSVHYVVGHLFYLVAYLCMALSFYLVVQPFRKR